MPPSMHSTDKVFCQASFGVVSTQSGHSTNFPLANGSTIIGATGIVCTVDLQHIVISSLITGLLLLYFCFCNFIHIFIVDGRRPDISTWCFERMFLTDLRGSQNNFVIELCWLFVSSKLLLLWYTNIGGRVAQTSHFRLNSFPWNSWKRPFNDRWLALANLPPLEGIQSKLMTRIRLHGFNRVDQRPLSFSTVFPLISFASNCYKTIRHYYFPPYCVFTY